MADNWNGDDRASAPATQYGKGYDVQMSGMQANESGANAVLSDTANNTQIKLTITAIQTDMSLSGSEGQSAMQKDFYPRNFSSPAFNVTVQARSQKEVGRIAEFIHKAQRHAVSRGSLMRLVVPGGGLKNTRATVNNQGMRGVRKGLQMTGYVKSVPRTHSRFVQAPLITFDFAVARMEAGPFHDDPYKVYKLAKWSEIVDAVMTQNFIKSPDVQHVEDVVDEFISVGKWLGDLVD